MEEITSIKDFESKVLKSNKLVLVDFGSPDCASCKKIKPMIEKAAEKQKDDLEVFYIDVAKNTDTSQIATQLKFRALPTLIFFRYGNAIKTITGLSANFDVQELIKHFLEEN